MNLSKLIVTIVLSFVLFTAAVAQKAEIFQKDGFAIRGYDPVAFHTEGKAVKGQEAFELEWRDARWLFASEENMTKFKADPERFAPQFGGYCAYGTADGHKAPTETDTWTVDQDKLYFNYNKKVQTLWNKDRPGYIEKANKNWPEIKDKE